MENFEDKELIKNDKLNDLVGTQGLMPMKTKERFEVILN